MTVGAPASFGILDANPLVDITNLRAISAVVLHKRVLGAEELAKLRQWSGSRGAKPADNVGAL